ncbi:MAG: class I SAM-dependent DNA methyltransferase [Thermomicrobiales bacterium]
MEGRIVVTPQEFQAKWAAISGTERALTQQHFLDLCKVLGQPSPTDADRHGAFYTFEKKVIKAGGGPGFADVWLKDHFAWEYKREKRDLDAAYAQIIQYKDDLGNPPLLVVCDLHRFRVHTNFTGTAKKIYQFDLDTFDQPENQQILRWLFTDPERLKPSTTTEGVTREAAIRFGSIAQRLAARNEDPHRTAHFLVQVLFCLFAEDNGLLPRGLVAKTLSFCAKFPSQFPEKMASLLQSMAAGGFFNMEVIPHFNGGLFREVDVVALDAVEIGVLAEAAKLDWSSIEPAIFGTLFERSLDPNSRAQLGAHYTGRADIERVVDPVVMTPLRRRWDVVREDAAKVKAAWDAATTVQIRRNRQDDFARVILTFQEELTKVRVLDPACGSGNFLYVALAKIMDLEKEVLRYGAENGLSGMFPAVRPSQMLGIEINEYARELAQVVIWIGYLQWMIANGFSGLREPILEPLETIEHRDALLDGSDPARPQEAAWPPADFIIGNPPFLGGKRLRSELGDTTVHDLFAAYNGSVPREADLVCYFLERARAEIAAGHARRAGLLATNSIRGGANRRVLDRIKRTGEIIEAWSDEPWVLNGAAVRISIVAFDAGESETRILNGAPVVAINSDLTAATDLSATHPLAENAGIGFQGFGKAGAFDIPAETAKSMLNLPVNVHGRPNSDVIKPWVNSLDVTRRPRGMYIIDFGLMPMEAAALYEAPFEYARRHVKPLRDDNRDKLRRTYWWRLGRSGQDLRKALHGRVRFMATPTVAKHRVFVWLDGFIIADHQLNFFAREDDYFFGVRHSRAHEVWSLRMGTSLEDRPRYTPTTCFETFPLPWAPGTEPVDDPRVIEIGAAAKALDNLPRSWLDPEGASEAELKKRTLTNLYNQRPTWLANAHARLDRAVWEAYGWSDGDPSSVPEDVILSRLLDLNMERSNGPT